MSNHRYQCKELVLCYDVKHLNQCFGEAFRTSDPGIRNKNLYAEILILVLARIFSTITKETLLY